MRLFQSCHGLAAIGHIDFRLHIEQQHGFLRCCLHLLDACARIQCQHIRAHAVGRLRQNAQRCARGRSQGLRSGINGGVIRMILRFRAQHHRRFIGLLQGIGNGTLRILCQTGQETGPIIRMQHFLRKKRHMQRFFAAAQHAQCCAALGRAAQACRQERLFFAQIGTNHQYGIVVAEIFNTLTQPLRTFEAV